MNEKILQFILFQCNVLCTRDMEDIQRIEDFFCQTPPPLVGLFGTFPLYQYLNNFLEGFSKASEDQKFKLVGFGLMVLLQIV